MTAKYLIIAGSFILLALGVVHLIFTLFTNKFSSQNTATMDAMAADFPILTKETSIWKAWIGFNASHSSGVLFMGLINLIIASQYFELYQKSIALLLLNDAACLFYLYLAKKYWFKAPFQGIFVVTTCFVVATILILF